MESHLGPRTAILVDWSLRTAALPAAAARAGSEFELVGWKAAVACLVVVAEAQPGSESELVGQRAAFAARAAAAASFVRWR